MYLPGNPSRRKALKPRSQGQVILIALLTIFTLLGTAFFIARSSSRPPSTDEATDSSHAAKATHHQPDVIAEAATFKEPHGVDGGMKVVTETFSKEIKTPGSGLKPQPNQVPMQTPTDLLDRPLGLSTGLLGGDFPN